MFNIKNSQVDISPEEAIDLVDHIAVDRPVPRREYDQIYIKGNSLVEQVAFVYQHMAGKRVLFLGDADGMALALASLNSSWKIGIEKAVVLDFDERVLKSHRKFLHGINCGFLCETRLYNIIDPVPNDLRKSFDFFYINPPYGSKNKGMSAVLWLQRCLEMCREVVSGCIVMPWPFDGDKSEPWMLTAQKTMKQHLSAWGLSLDEVGPSQAYHLPDNPELISRAILVSTKSNPFFTSIESCKYSFSQVKNLYGDPRRLPQYILKNKTNPLGDESELSFSDKGWCVSDTLA